MTARKNLILTVAAAAVAGTAIFGAGLAQARPDAHGGKRGPAQMPIIFSELDADGNGVVTKEEMQARAQTRFDAADTNGDGKLSVDEMVAAAEARAEDAMKKRAEQMSERMAKRTERLIENKDTDGDGMLTMAELEDTKSRGDRFFDRLDADGDGVVSQEEFDAAKARWMQRAGKSRGE